MSSHLNQNPLLLNPQAVGSIIPYAIYNTHKVARKQVQAQRQQAQHTISFLERQAKRSVKQLEHKEKSLVDFYKLKETRFEEMKKKQQHRKKHQEDLDRLRQTNSALREYSANKRSTVRMEWQRMNQKLASDVKHVRSESQRKLSQERSLERSLLKKRNEVFSRAIALGNEHSRIKTFYSKRFISSQVKNDLISVQENIKNRQMEKISDLSSRQQQLLEIVEKTRRQHHTYDDTLSEVKSLPFEQMYPKIKSVQGKSGRSRRPSHDSLII